MLLKFELSPIFSVSQLFILGDFISFPKLVNEHTHSVFTCSLSVIVFIFFVFYVGCIFSDGIKQGLCYVGSKYCFFYNKSSQFSVP